MKVVDGKAYFPIKVIEISSDIDDEVKDFISSQNFIDFKREVYDTDELNFVSFLLTEKEIAFTISDLAPIDKKEAETFTFKNNDELVKYLNEGIAPRNKTVEQLEDEIKVLEDALLTLMFSEVNGNV